MSKAEALAAVNAEGSLQTLRRSPAWDKAFEAYNAAHPGDRKSQKCGSCWRAVQKWLQG
jgi:hypothetical protein